MTATQLFRSWVSTVVSPVFLPVHLIALVVLPMGPQLADTVAGWTARRLSWVDRSDRSRIPGEGRRAGFQAVQFMLGLAAAIVVVLIVFGLVVVFQVINGAATGAEVPSLSSRAGEVTWKTVAYFAIPGLALFLLALSGLSAVHAIERRCWTYFAAPGAMELNREVSRLHTTLDDVVAAVDSERRRIERDIHDGVQQRVVALSILIGRVERTSQRGDSVQSAELLSQAKVATQQILEELRDVSWRTYPSMLERDGLHAALEALRDRTTLPMDLTVSGLTGAPLDQAVQTALYFVVSESVTNVVKHAGASRITATVVRTGGAVEASVTDDGRGGADSTGPGFSGISSRVRACGGTMDVDSPTSGPTTVTVVIPCA